MAIKPKTSIFKRGANDDLKAVDIYESADVHEVVAAAQRGEASNGDVALAAMRNLAGSVGMGADSEVGQLLTSSSAAAPLMLDALGLDAPSGMRDDYFVDMSPAEAGEHVEMLAVMSEFMSASGYNGLDNEKINYYASHLGRFFPPTGGTLSPEAKASALAGIGFVQNLMATYRDAESQLNELDAYAYGSDYEKGVIQDLMLEAAINGGNVNLIPALLNLAKATLAKRRRTIVELLKSYRLPSDRSDLKAAGNELYGQLIEIKAGWDESNREGETIADLLYYPHASEDAMIVLNNADVSTLDAVLFKKYRGQTGTVQSVAMRQYPGLRLS